MEFVLYVSRGKDTTSQCNFPDSPICSFKYSIALLSPSCAASPGGILITLICGVTLSAIWRISSCSSSNQSLVVIYYRSALVDLRFASNNYRAAQSQE